MSNNHKLPRPFGHNTLTPITVVPGASKVVEFLCKAFRGEIVEKYEGPNGEVMHAEVKVGDSVIMVGEPFPGTPTMPVAVYLYVESADDVDSTYRRALDSGAKSQSEPAQQLWGYRTACVTDECGNRWTIATVTEQLTHDEVVERMAAASPS